MAADKTTRRDSRRRCRSTQRVTARSLLSFFLLLPVAAARLTDPINPPVFELQREQTFTLRHIFHRGTYQHPDLHRRLDIHPSDQNAFAFEEGNSDFLPPADLRVRAEGYEIDRLRDRSWPSIQGYLDHAGATGYPIELESLAWTRDEIPGPDTTDKETVINLAYMAANAYVPDTSDAEWSNITTGYNHSTPFGWEGDGLRGHIFADEGNKTIIIGLKGTSPAVFDGDGTTTRDKLNDNLFFSCCCAQGGQYFWRQVCDCQTSVNTCNSTCVVKALKSKTRYYHASVDLYNNVTELYPDSNIWIVGHSLGGAVSSLLGLTFGLPVVTFEAPGDDLAARRLGLPVPPPAVFGDPPNRGKYTGARHFGHTADPIFTGTCNTATATCTLGGYAMESQCHTGLQCVYDTVSDMGWRSGIGYHKIHNVIDTVIRKYKTLPKCIADTECYDCYKWKFFESNGSEPITTTTTKKVVPTYTRTTTCKTPGWWGCLDPSSTSSTPIITTTYTTTTCLTPGWFGCKEAANTTITTTTLAPTTSTTSAATTASNSATTTSCRHGWFGDDCGTTTTFGTRTTPTQTSTTEEVCETPGIFFGCWDDDKKKKHHTTIPTTITSPPATATKTVTSTGSIPATSTTSKDPEDEKCKHPVFFGLICLDSKSAQRQQIPQTQDSGGHSSEL